MPIVNLYNLITGWLYPPSCAVCSELVQAPGGLCGKCWGKLHLIGDLFDPIVDAAPSDGLDYHFGYVCKVHHAVIFNPMASKLVSSLKYRDNPALATTLGHFITQRLIQDNQAKPLPNSLHPPPLAIDLLVPVPLHWTRLWKRRYNQASLLASHLARRFNIPVARDILVRTRATRYQVGLSSTDRQQNVKGAFCLHHANNRLDGLTIGLVDDIYTTGATIGECAKVLTKSGATRVVAIVFAVTQT